MNQSLQPALDAVMPAARATGLFSSLATFQVPSGGLTDTGFPDGSYTDVAGLIDIACQVSSSRFDRAAGTTNKSLATQQAMGSDYIMLSDYYPDAETVWRNGGRVVIDGAIFPNEDIMTVDSDSQHRHTSMLIRMVTE